MKLLVTSGGTKIPIDRVRDITNMSKGTFGSKIAAELLRMGHEVVFFKAKGSAAPYKFSIDLHIHGDEDISTHLQPFQDLLRVRKNYREYEYSTFDQYAEALKFVIGVEQPDVILLAAAVSDYGVENFVNGKVRSNDMFSIKLKQLPKLIYYVKEWAPNAKLVGFKLLVNSKTPELLAAAARSIQDNKCDMIVANDLQDIKDNNHTVHLVFPEQNTKTFKTDPKDPNFLARMVAEHSVKL